MDRTISTREKFLLSSSPILIGMLVLAISLRFSLFYFESGDAKTFLLPWYKHIAMNGGFVALSGNFSNYLPNYLYFLATATYLPFTPLVSIKLFSLLFDLALGGIFYHLLLLFKSERKLAIWGGLSVLFLPTVFLNSSAWAQCDALYTTLLLIMLLALLKGRTELAMLFFGVALATKLQSIFAAPFILWAIGANKLRWKDTLWVLTGWTLSVAPMLLAGRGLLEIIKTYHLQSSYYSALTMNAPSIFALIPNTNSTQLTLTGIVLAAAFATILICTFIHGRNSKSPYLIALVYTISCYSMPFLLPRMHERYFFPADIFTLFLAWINPGLWWLALLQQILSLSTYLRYLFGSELFSLTLAGLGSLIVFIALCVELFRECSKNTDTNVIND